ncbi:MAG: lipoprotein insertase outer membrane protein LolB [Burkholderiaceae bacterium]|jgi:outer membrane biogenesis lipoprotein LolB
MKPHAALLWCILPLLLAACAGVPPDVDTSVDCRAPQAICRNGRFGLIWQPQQTAGGEQIAVQALSGNYAWQSLPNGAADLQLNSSLGPAIAQVSVRSGRYRLRTADGRTIEAASWQALFDQIFPFGFPAQALIDWFTSPSPEQPPPLPRGWRWEVRDRHYRMLHDTATARGRIDLLPDER